MGNQHSTPHNSTATTSTLTAQSPPSWSSQKPPFYCCSASSSSSSSSVGDDDDLSGRRNRGHRHSDDDDRSVMSSVHGNLMHKRVRCDPYKIFEVECLLGEGSMGSVSKVRKRQAAKGGSARPEYVRKTAGCCFPLLRFLPFTQHYDKTAFTAVMPSPYPSFGNLLDLQSRQSTPNSSRHGLRNRLTGTAIAEAASARLMDETKGSNQAPPYGTVEERKLVFKKSSSLISYGSRKDKHYALKSIHLSRCSSDEYKDELRNEVAILKSLDHPNIVKAMETFDYRDRLYLVLELCSGGDLYSRDPYTEQNCVRIIKSLLSAVSYLHSKGIVHRDLKFENVMFCQPNEKADIKIIDFGLSQKFAANQFLHDAVGTVYTMSPELIAGQYTSQTDVWSLGVLSFMLLSSSMPFFGRDRKAVIKSIVKGKFHFASQRWFYVSPDGRQFVKTLLQTDPDKRPTADEALQLTWMNRSFDPHGNAPEIDMMDRVQGTIEAFADYGMLKKLALMVIAYKSTSEEIGYLRDMFNKYDKFHNGEIDIEEFKATLSENYSYTDEEVRTMFKGMDIDGTGTVHYCEFLAATIEAHGSIDEERLAEAFDRIDSDDTGYITASDLKAFLGSDIPNDYIENIIDEADISQDQRIDYEEFVNMWNEEGDIKLKNAEMSVHSRRNTSSRNGQMATCSSGDRSVVSSLSEDDLTDSERGRLGRLPDAVRKEASMGRSSFYFTKQKQVSLRGICF